MTQDLLPISGTDYVEFYVGNAKQAAHYYQSAFGFQPVAYAGLETGLKDRASYVLRQGKITLVLTGALTPGSAIAEHHKLHGDGVKVIALNVEDAKKAFEETVSRGAKPAFEPKEDSDQYGTIKTSAIYTYGETIHVFVERKNYNGLFLPGFIEWKPQYQPSETGLLYVDHIVGNVNECEMADVLTVPY